MNKIKIYSEKEKKKKLNIHSDNSSSNGIVNALFGGRSRMIQEVQPEEEEEYEAPLVNPVDDMDKRRKNMRKAFFRQRSEWASMADEQRRLTMESIENQFLSNEEEIKDINLE
jgi:hypothetical protein